MAPFGVLAGSLAQGLTPLRRRPRSVAFLPFFFQLLCDPGGCRVGQAARMAAAFQGRRSRGMPFFRPSAFITSRPVSAGFMLCTAAPVALRRRRNGALRRNGKTRAKGG